MKRKKLLMILLTMIMGSGMVMTANAQSQPIEFSVGVLGPGVLDPYPGGNPYPKSEPVCPEVTQNGNILSFSYGHADYTLCLTNEDGLIVYSVLVPSTTVSVILPLYLEGEFELWLHPDDCNYYFYGYIEL